MRLQCLFDWLMMRPYRGVLTVPEAVNYTITKSMIMHQFLVLWSVLVACLGA